jgi:hypothetical protein
MPGYYAAFNHGEIISRQQRYGLSLLWSKRTGIVWQSQTHNDPACWGTRINDTTLIEALDLDATVLVDGQPFVEGKKELTVNSIVEIEYTTDGASKQILFRPNEIEVKVSGKGNLREVLPLLLDGEATVTFEANGIKMKKKDGGINIIVKGASIEEEIMDFVVEGIDLRSVRLSAVDNLTYTLHIE